MTQNGYMLVKMAKTLDICLWAETVEELTGDLTEDELKPYEVVPCYRHWNMEYIKYHGKLYRI